MSSEVVAPCILPRAPSITAERIKHALTMAPGFAVHFAVFAVPFVEFTRWSIPAMLFFAYFAGLGVSVGYHRYFAHRSYKTSRAFQFFIGFVGCASLQNGPLWWASTHRNHHAHSDEAGDPHSPVLHGFWHSHIGWMLSRKITQGDYARIKDFTVYPELVWLNRLFMLPALACVVTAYWLMGWNGVVWGYCLGTALAFQITLAIGSVGHTFGPQRFDTGDSSRNNFILGIVALGDGWHNNHHRAPSSAQEGFLPHESDLGYNVIRGLKRLGIVWDVKLPPPSVLQETNA
ncbi:MAG: acyl-CoA desaturase [Pirellula sp.]|nr:acyl-CoA desaturase [Pirellula sp.]